MSLDPGFHPAARAEVLAEVDHLDTVRPGLSEEFVAALSATLEIIGTWPGAGRSWPDRLGGQVVRSFGLRRFPFRVVYLVEGGSCTVLAVAHQSREPGYWASRVE